MRAVAQEAENENAAPGVTGECDVVPERVESRARQRLRKELGSLAHPGSQDKVIQSWLKPAHWSNEWTGA